MFASTSNSRISKLASLRQVHQAFHWLHLHEPQLRKWQLEMIAIPAPPFGEQARAVWFCDRFTELGLTNVHIDAEGNALAELNTTGNPDSPVVLLSAHLDTVFPAGTDCTPTEDGAKILAPGASDNAAGLTALLGIAAALLTSSLRTTIAILFTANCGEEAHGNLRGMRHLFTQSPYKNRIKAAIALEGHGTSPIITHALGSRRFKLTLTGPGGHSWADASNPNPINELAQVITALAALNLPVDPRTTLNIGLIHGGTAINAIPESATCELDLRSTDANQLRQTEQQVLQIVTGTLLNSTLRLNLELTGDRPAAALPSNSPLLQTIKSVDRHLSIRTEPRIGSTDANIPLFMGIPAIAIAAGGTGGNIHTLREWYDPTNRALALRRILLILLDTCST